MKKRIRRTPIIGRVIAGVLGVILTVPLAALVSCFKDNKNNDELYNKGVSFVAIDINPSVELLLDEDDKVVSVYAANEDAEIMLYNSEGILGKHIGEASVKLAQLSEKYGYITEENTSVSAVAVAENDEKSKGLFEQIKTSFEKGCDKIKVSVQECNDAIIGAMLEKLKEQYPDDSGVQNLDVTKYRLVRSAMAADRTLKITDAAKMTVEELTAIVDAKRAETKNIISKSMGMAVESAELLCLQTQANFVNGVYLKYGGFEAVKYIALDNAYFTVALLSKTKNDLAQFGITEEAVRDVALKLGIPMEKVDEFVADCKTPEGYITDETLSYAANKWYRNADEALRNTMEKNMPEFTEKLKAFSEQVGKVTGPVVGAIDAALDALKSATGLEFSFAIKTYEDVETLAAELKVKADESKKKMLEGLTEEQLADMEADIAELSEKMQKAEDELQSAIDKARSEAEEALRKAQEKRLEQVK